MKAFFITCSLLMSTFSIAGRISLPETSMKFSSNSDVTVTKVILRIDCARSATVWEMLNNGMGHDETCKNFKVNAIPYGYIDWAEFELVNSGVNEYLIDYTTIDFRNYRRGTACITIKVELDNVPSYREKRFINDKDKFSVLTYCSAEKVPDFFVNKPHFENRKVKSLEAFKAALKSGIDLKLK
jgi:hypothetical protein